MADMTNPNEIKDPEKKRKILNVVQELVDKLEEIDRETEYLLYVYNKNTPVSTRTQKLEGRNIPAVMYLITGQAYMGQFEQKKAIQDGQTLGEVAIRGDK